MATDPVDEMALRALDWVWTHFGMRTAAREHHELLSESASYREHPNAAVYPHMPNLDTCEGRTEMVALATEWDEPAILVEQKLRLQLSTAHLLAAVARRRASPDEAATESILSLIGDVYQNGLSVRDTVFYVARQEARHA